LIAPRARRGYDRRWVADAAKEVREMSNPESMQQLADRFMNDADFREQMQQDPEGAAERSGFALDDEDRQALRSMDWSGTDQELKERVSKRVTARWC
jgi:hypothetical protein